MILIGLTGWGDHPAITAERQANEHKLYRYSSHFPVVEVDSSFYAIQPAKNYHQWIAQTPNRFQFVIKAFQALTGHDRKERSNFEVKEMVQSFIESIQPVIESNKLHSVLFQFPPWFRLNKSNIQKLIKLKDWIGDIPASIEFRNRTWFGKYTRDTMMFLQEENWIHTICDEPQAGESSIPIVFPESNQSKVLIRFHGRNVHGWNNHGQENWREVRFLYRYRQTELEEWAERIQHLKQKTNDITILFNNNSGGDAYDNAKQFMDILDISYDGLHPKQMNLFEDLL
ncbi:hypothetical protein J416_04758 [Gracilibacillus halophilus YIM-C55.5]|uniref:DUF72 domain-containing protein n=1 Tax=Gracilibacillus halophilus YIM-C55.5 TaxID=1308866 RepID=N4WSC2_9BACI|nr:DUF72 domain-containing protein [Gracilibacillus halophilus]ENH97300.1 hypothetical protein J416_04758 [Gracilibacillus halophilus YIM-C55.5]